MRAPRSARAAAALCLLLFAAALPAQEAPSAAETAGTVPEAAASPPDATVYTIRHIDYRITGHTRASALAYHGELRTGERITGRQNLERYVERRRQLLYDQRALEDAFIMYSLGLPEEDGTVPVDLFVITRDSFNFIILPKPKISASAIDITLKARDYNFLGSLSPLRLDFGYSLDTTEEGRSGFADGTWNFVLDSDIPIRFLNLNFNINFDHDFRYTHSDDEPLYYQNTTGLSLELPVSFTTAVFGFDQITTIRENNSKKYEGQEWDLRGGRFEPAFTTTEAFVEWSIPTPLEIGNFGFLTYEPRLAGFISYRPGSEGWDPGYFRRGFNTRFRHRIGFGQIDWVLGRNFREGISLYLGNENTWNFSREEFDATWNVEFIGHLPVTSFFGVSGRLLYRQRLTGLPEESEYRAGEAMRGIPDRKIQADQILYLNLDFPFRFLLFEPSKWTGNRKFRVVEMEGHFSPVVDIAIFRSLATGNPDYALSAGFELVGFPLFFRRFIPRFYLAFDITDIIRGGRLGDWDFLITLDHHF